MNEPEDDREKPEDCDACHWATAALTHYNSCGMRPQKWICDLCASTWTSRTLDYPGQWPDKTADIAQIVCYVGNAILDALRKRP